MVTGSRFLDARRRRLPLVGLAPRSGIRLFARRAVDGHAAAAVTDPTSGFRMVDRRGIELFARDYPHDYPEVEAVLLLHFHRLEGAEVPVRMRAAHDRRLVDQRAAARSTT